MSDWKTLRNDRRRCRIFSCHDSGLCCADCSKGNCKKRCLNSPERCGQVIQREAPEMQDDREEKSKAAAREHFYSEKDDAWETSAFTRKRRI